MSSVPLRPPSAIRRSPFPASRRSTDRKPRFRAPMTASIPNGGQARSEDDAWHVNAHGHRISAPTRARLRLETHVAALADGRTVALRRAVPSDAPRISVAFGSRDDRWGRDAIAFDDHGSLVGLAASALDVEVASGWADSGLEPLLVKLAAS